MGILFVLSSLAACGGGDGRRDAGGEDAGPDGGTGLVVEAPAVPAEAAAASLLPCPEGWSEVVDPTWPELVSCNPWPAGGAPNCAADEVAWPGGGGCARIGTNCPAGEFPEDLPAGADVVYVSASAAPGGDGTIALPFDTIAAALVASADDGIVALGKGTFDEIVQVRRPVTIRGACVADTFVTSTDPDPLSAIVTTSSRAGATFENLRIGGARPAFQILPASDPVVVTSVLVEDATTVGFSVVDGGTLVANDVVVRDTLARPGGGDLGYAVAVEAGGHVEIHRGSIESCRSVALFVADAGSTLVADRLAIRDMLPEDRSGYFGMALDVSHGAAVEIDASVFERARTVGATVHSGGASLTMRDVLVDDTRAQEADAGHGSGIEVVGDATVTLERVHVSASRISGIAVSGLGATLDASDVVVSDTAGRESDGEFGTGLQVEDSGVAHLDRALAVRTRSAALHVFGAGSEIDARDAVVLDTRGSVSDGATGIGLMAEAGGRLTAVRARVAHSRATGINVSESEAVVEDATIEDGLGQDVDGALGSGVEVVLGGHLVLSRAVLRRNRAFGLHVVSAGSSLEATDVAVADMAQTDYSCGLGVAMLVLRDAEATVVRGVFERAIGAGVGAILGGELALEDVVVRETLDCCAPTPECEPILPGSGIVALEASHVEVTRFRAEHNALCGVQVAHGGEMDLHHGEVRDNVFGANVQTPGFDLARIQDDVAYIDNGQSLDTSELPVPGVEAK